VGAKVRWRRGAVPALAVAGMLVASSAAIAQTGGSVAPGTPTGTTTTPTTPTVPATPGVATLQADGSALAPPDAPRNVRKAINAANRIRYKPYIWGGGHRKWKAKGYDCSGAVSYVLHAAGLLKKPMTSGDLARRWGSYGLGQWITVYANPSHTYAVIAGLRWDTSAVGEPVNNGSGPRWRSTARTPTGYSSKYFLGL
jgi:hypothetical protein